MNITETRIPLSFVQEQLWLVDELDPGQPTYNVVLVWRLHGSLDTGALQRALTLLVERHDALRVRVEVVDGTPFQVIGPPGGVELELIDEPGLAPDERDAAVARAITTQTSRPFDLATGPLYRYTLYRFAADDYLFCQSFHHLAVDGWSCGLLNTELTAAYRELVAGREPELPEVRRSYPAFVQDQRERLSGEGLAEELEFWAEQLADLPVLELPRDRPRPATATHQGATVIWFFPDDLLESARSLAREHQASLFMVLSAAVNVVLSRYTGQVDFPVGVPMPGRPEPELEDIVGMFINMVVMRSDVSGDPSFTELVERTADTFMDMYMHQEVAFHQVVSRVQPVRDASRNPLFQVSVQVLGGGTRSTDLALPGLTEDYPDIPSVRSRWDLSLNFIESPERLAMGVEYSTDLFDRWRVEALLGHLETVLRAVAADPGLRVSEIPLLSEVERGELLAAGRGEVVPYVTDPLHVAVSRVAAAAPDAVAVVCRGVELTYGELDRRADRLARYLRSRGLGRDQVVAVVVDRDLDAYVAMLGVLKAGAAYAMLDPASPASRLEFMLRDTGAPLVVTRSWLVDRLPVSAGWGTVLLDADWPAVEAVPAEEPLVEWAGRESLAYVLYTSGSTGEPKGVMVSHRGVALFAEGYRRTFDFGPRDRLLQLPSLTFDMSQGELWTALLNGATVVAVAAEELSSPAALAELMRVQRVSYAGLPRAIQSLLDEPASFPDLKYVMGGAEVLPPELVNKWNLPGRRYVNLYGPTEAAVACVEYECPHIVWDSSPPIGRPQVNRQVYIVDRSLNLVPRGVPGELLVGGEEGGLARGYVNQPELTAQRFIPDPFHPGRTVYRTGDLVRWNEQAQIEFLGRVDNQVKLRGLRIELGEVEAVLQEHPDVRLAVVALRPDRQGDDRLVGYVVPAGGRAPAVASLREHLGRRLPEYMVPTAWVVLDTLPMSGSGWKIDREALPDPVEQVGGDDDDFVAPRTPTEEAITRIFAEILEVPRVSAEASFFSIGGSSLLAMRVINLISKQLGVRLRFRNMYGHATLSSVAALVDDMLTRVRVDGR